MKASYFKYIEQGVAGVNCAVKTRYTVAFFLKNHYREYIVSDPVKLKNCSNGIYEGKLLLSKGLPGLTAQ
jgi:hypothetical protein